MCAHLGYGRRFLPTGFNLEQFERWLLSFSFIGLGDYPRDLPNFALNIIYDDPALHFHSHFDDLDRISRPHSGSRKATTTTKTKMPVYAFSLS